MIIRKVNELKSLKKHEENLSRIMTESVELKDSILNKNLNETLIGMPKSVERRETI